MRKENIEKRIQSYKDKADTYMLKMNSGEESIYVSLKMIEHFKLRILELNEELESLRFE